MTALEQTLEVFLKLSIGGGGGAVARNEYHIVPMLQRFAMSPQNFTHTPAKQIPNYRVAQSFSRDNPGAGFLCVCTLAGIRQGAEYKKTPCCG